MNSDPTLNASAKPDSSTPSSPEPAFGWTSYAEIINGRFAMIGFVALLLLELFTQQDFFTWLGLR
jgi:hypothetical protein